MHFSVIGCVLIFRFRSVYELRIKWNISFDSHVDKNRNKWRMSNSSSKPKRDRKSFVFFFGWKKNYEMKLRLRKNIPSGKHWEEYLLKIYTKSKQSDWKKKNYPKKLRSKFVWKRMNEWPKWSNVQKWWKLFVSFAVPFFLLYFFCASLAVSLMFRGNGETGKSIVVKQKW